MTDLEDKNEWKNCIDITGVRLPTGYYFGASAGTGDLSGECERMLWAVSSAPSPQAFLSLPSCDCWCAQSCVLARGELGSRCCSLMDSSRQVYRTQACMSPLGRL